MRIGSAPFCFLPNDFASLLGSEGLHWIEMGCAPGGDHAGESCDKQEQRSDRCEDHRVQGFSLVEHRSNETHCDGARPQAQQQSDEGGAKTVE